MKIKANVKGLDKRLLGAVGGGAASAVIDSFVTPNLPASLSAYPDYVKLGIGVVLPMFVKGQTVMSISDGIMSCAAQNIVGNLLTGSEIVTGIQPARRMVGSTSFYPRMLKAPKKTNPANPAKNMVGKVIC